MPKVKVAGKDALGKEKYKVKEPKKIKCCVCDVSEEDVNDMFRLNTGDHVCGKRCLFKFAWKYFKIVTLKGRPLLNGK